MPAMLTEFRQELIALIETALPTTFTAIKDGRLPRLMGEDGNYAGVSPDSQSPAIGQGLDQQTSVLVQFYMAYEKTRPIDPTLVLSPAPIEEAVQTFQEAAQDAIGSGSTGERWYYTITAINYPADPIGQKTRAELTVVARGGNPAVVETSA